jgi:hypothetical protein
MRALSIGSTVKGGDPMSSEILALLQGLKTMATLEQPLVTA